MNESSDPQLPPCDGVNDDTPDNCLDSTLIKSSLLHKLVEKFEQELQNGRDPKIADYLRDVPPPQRLQVLAELIPKEMEVEDRWNIDEQTAAKPRIEDYFTDWPDLRANTQVLRDLIHFECAVRILHGDQPSLIELMQRFPQVESAPLARILSELTVIPQVMTVQTSPRSGFQWGKYEIEKKLGTGAFGSVHLARDIVLERQVVLKIPRSGDFTSTWLAEAQKQVKLAHDGIVRVYDVYTAHELPAVIVMEYVKGGTLEKLIESGPIEHRLAAELMVQIAEAVAEAHRNGIIHRDLKPANILLTEMGRAKVSDFGLAVRYDAQQNPEVAGTLAYMSPEHFRGEVEPRSDIWSLGIILCEMLTGKRPFPANSNNWVPRLRELEDHRQQQTCEHFLQDFCPDVPELLRACFKR